MQLGTRLLITLFIVIVWFPKNASEDYFATVNPNLLIPHPLETIDGIQVRSSIVEIVWSIDSEFVISRSPVFGICVYRFGTDDNSFLFNPSIDPNDTSAIAINHDSTVLATGHSDGTIKLWSIKDANELITFSENASRINSLDFSPNNNILVSVAGGTAIAWNVETGEIMLMIDEYLRAATFGPSGNQLILTSSHFIYVWDLLSNTQLAEFWSDLPITDIAIGPEGTIIAVAGANTPDIGFIDLTTGEWLNAIAHGHDVAYAIDFNSNGTAIATAGDGLDLLLITITNHRIVGGTAIQLQDWRTGNQGVAFSPTEDVLASGGYKLWLWDAQTGDLLASYDQCQ